MKKLAASLMAVTVASSLAAGAAHGANLNMIVNGKPLEFASGTPFIENGSSLMPLRDLLVGLGVQGADIAWDGTTRTVTAKLGDITITLTVGDKAVYKNGVKFKDLEVPAKQVDGRVYLPARAVAEALGNTVGFDAATNSVVIGSAAGGAATGGAAGTGGAQAGASAGSGSTSSSTSGVSGSFTTKGGIPVSISNLQVGAGQIAGFVYDYNPSTGAMTLKLADGTEKNLTLADESTLTFFGNSHVHTGKEYKQYFSAGMAIVASTDAKGKIASLSVSTIDMTGVVEDVAQETIDNAVDADGKPIKLTLTDIFLNVGGKTIRFTSSSELGKLPKVGDTVTVSGSVKESEGFISGQLISLKIK